MLPPVPPLRITELTAQVRTPAGVHRRRPKPMLRMPASNRGMLTDAFKAPHGLLSLRPRPENATGPVTIIKDTRLGELLWAHGQLEWASGYSAAQDQRQGVRYHRYFPGTNDTVNAPPASVVKRPTARPDFADTTVKEVTTGVCTSPTPTPQTPGATSTGVP